MEAEGSIRPEILTNSSDEDNPAPRQGTSEGEPSPSQPKRLKTDCSDGIGKSQLWNYFTKVTRSERGKALTSGRCQVCKTEIKTKQGNTSGLKKHLKIHSSRWQEFCTLTKRLEKEKANLAATKDSQQQSLPATFGLRWKPGSKSHENLNKLVANMLVSAMLPFNFVHDVGFRALMNEIVPLYEVPSRTTFSRNVIPKMYEAKRTILLNELNKDIEAGLESISFTTDGWTSRNNDSYISLTAHYLSENGIYKSPTLGLHLLNESHTGVAIESALMDMAEKWGMTEDRFCDIPAFVITDNAANMDCAFKDSWWERHSCFSHTLQLSIKDAKEATPGMNLMMEKAKAIVSHYHRSSSASERLSQRQIDLKMKPLQVIQSCVTRWNSENEMLERLLYLKEPLILELSNSKTNVNPLSNYEWELCESLVKVLAPFKEATELLGGNTYPTRSCVIPVLQCLETGLENFRENENDKYKKKNTKSDNKGVNFVFASNLSTSLKTRFPDYTDNYPNKMSMIVDPRFKAALMDVTVAEKELGSVISLPKSSEVLETGCTDSGSKKELSRDKSKSLWDTFDHLVRKKQEASESNKRTNKCDSTYLEIATYLTTDREPRNTNPFTWWQEKGKAQFPNIWKIAKRFLPIPATQVNSERLFSAAGKIVIPQRQSLDPENIEEIIFLHCNTDFNLK